MTVLACWDQTRYSMDSAGDQEVASYQDSLRDLRQNSKPLINMLTMLAEENFHQGTAIVRVIEDHIKQAVPREKLPALYLVDSIVKNVTQGDYRPLFRPRLVGIVCHIFRQVTDEAVKRAIFKLRETWNGVFDDASLEELDRELLKIDPNWPVAPKPVAPKPVAPRPVASSVVSVPPPLKVAPIGRIHPLQQTVSAPPPPQRATTAPSAAIPQPVKKSSPVIPLESSDLLEPAGTAQVKALPKRQEHVPNPLAGRVVKGTPRNARTVIPQQKVSDVSVAMGSLEPPKGKPTPPAVAVRKVAPSPKSRPNAKAPVRTADPPVRTVEPPVRTPEAVTDQSPVETVPLRSSTETVPVPAVKTSSTNEEVKKPLLPRLPRIPKKEGVQGNRGGAAGRGAQRRSPAAAARPGGRSPLGRIPKRVLDQREPSQLGDVARRKFQKTGSDRPPYSVRQAEDGRHSSPPPGRDSRFVVKKYPEQSKYTQYPAQVGKMNQPRSFYSQRQQPYPGDRNQQHDRQPQRWVAPESQYAQGMDGHYMQEQQRPLQAPLLPTPVAPLLPTPVTPPVVTVRMVYERQMEEARRRLAVGELSAVQFQQFQEQTLREFEVLQLREAVEESLLQGGMVRDMGGLPPIYWVQNRPVTVQQGKIFDIRFEGLPVDVFIDEEIIVKQVAMNEPAGGRTVFFGNGWHKIKFGAPNYELVVDEVSPYRMAFGGPPMTLLVDGLQHKVRLGGPEPTYAVGEEALNEVFFGPPSVPVDEKRNAVDAPVSTEELLNRILASPAFAQLGKTPAAPVATPVVLQPLSVAVPVGDGLSGRVGGGTPTSSSSSAGGVVVVPRGGDEEENQLRTVFQSAYRMFEPKDQQYINVLVDGPFLPSLRNLENVNPDLWQKRLYLGSLKTIHLKANYYYRDHLAREKKEFVCEERFVPNLFGEEETLPRNIVLRNGFTQRVKDNIHVADWLLDATEFTNEKSFISDTSVEDLEKMFSDFATKVRVGKPVEGRFDGSAGSAPLPENNEDSEFVVLQNPVVKSKRNFCSLCMEQMVTEENEDEDLILKDGVKVTTKADGSIKYYHRDCFDQNIRRKPTDQTALITLSKPSRWGSDTIDTPVLLSRSAQLFPLDRRPSVLTAVSGVVVDGVKDSLVGGVSSFPSSSKNEDVVPSTSHTVSDDQSDLNFVISMGDDDEDDEDDFANIIFDETDG